MNSLPLFEGWSSKMAIAEYNNNSWSDAKVVTQANQQIHPAAMAMQFGASVFEGCKAFRSDDRQSNTFRVAENHARLENSCARLCIPSPSYETYFNAIKLIVSRSESWYSPFKSNWLYIRPIIAALDAHIMPIIASRYAFYLLTAPIRPFQSPTFNLWIEDRYSRAASGGLGSAKTGANYAHQLYPTDQAKKNGYDAVLWLNAANHSEIEEASTMNIFFRIADKVYTPALKDTILPGITRHSAISILRNEGWEVVERTITINEVLDWIRKKILIETFVTSTALGVREVDTISYQHEQYPCTHNASLSIHLKNTLLSIYQNKTDKYSEWISTITMQGY